MRDDGNIGQRLRALREARGVSLSALARSAGVGKATLSGLENGTRNPTLETLYAVTAQLGVPLAAVLDQPDTRRGPSVVRGEAVVATLLEVFDDGAVTYELYRMVIAPGRTQESPAHRRGVTEHITVFQGVLRTGPTDAPVLVRAGEHHSWAAEKPHVYAAEGGEEVRASLLMRYQHQGVPDASGTP